MIDTQCIATSSTPELFLFEHLLLVVAVLPLHHPLHSTCTTGALMEAIGTSFDDGLWWLALVQEVSVCLLMNYHLCSGDGGIVGNFCGQDLSAITTRAAFLQSSVLCWRIRWISRAASTSRTTHFIRAAPMRPLLLFVAMHSMSYRTIMSGQASAAALRTELANSAVVAILFQLTETDGVVNNTISIDIKVCPGEGWF